MAKKKPKSKGKKPAKRSSQSIKFKAPKFISSSWSALYRILEKRPVVWICAAACLFIFLAYFTIQGMDYDVWWHMQYGRHFIENMTWNIDHSAYSWVETSSDWIYVSWIGDVVFLVVHNIFGWAGLKVMQFIILLLISALFVYYLRKLSLPIDIVPVTVFLMTAVACNPAVNFVKPEIFSTLIFGLIVGMYFLVKSTKRPYYYAYPVIFLFWVNIHGGFFIGLFFLSSALFFEWFNYFVIKKNAFSKDLLYKFTIFIGISYVASFVNPEGLTYHLSLVQSFLSSSNVSEMQNVFAYLPLWKYLTPQTFDQYLTDSRVVNGVYLMAVMIGSLLLFAIRAFWKRRFFDISLICLNLGFYYFSMSMMRAMIYFPLIWLFSIMYLLMELRYERVKKPIIPAAAIVFIVTAAVSLHNAVSVYPVLPFSDFSIDHTIPVKETKFIKEHKLPGPVFNDYQIGGYLLWSMYPDYKPFMDPRFQPYRDGNWKEYITFEQGPNLDLLDKLNAKYPFRLAIIHYFKTQVIFTFNQSPHWKLLYFGEKAAVFAHESVADTLNTEELGEELGPERFSHVANPQSLLSLFDMYSHCVNLVLARNIRDYYAENISDLYIRKKGHIEQMDKILSIVPKAVGPGKIIVK